MKHLSRFDIEAIADKYVQAYMALPDVRNTQIYRIDPELLLEKVLGLNVEYQHLSYDGSILGMTSFTEMGVQVFEDDDNEAFFFLDGKTVLVEKDLNFDSKLKGRKNFTLMHEGSHQIFKMLFPNDYGVTQKSAGVHYYKANSERNKPISDKFLRSAFNQAVKWELMTRNPVLNATLPKEEHQKREIWTAETLMHALEVCDDDILALAINLSFACSLRMGEMLGLTWDCIDISEESLKENNASIFVDKELQRVNRDVMEVLDNKDIIRVFPRTLSNTNTSLVLKTPKTKTSVRKIFLPSTVAQMLLERKKQIDEMKELFSDEYLDYDLVFCHSSGRPMEGQVINRALKKLIQDNDLPDVVFHSFRHASITYKLKWNGGDMKSVQGDSGHARMDMVADVYSHIIDEDRRYNAQKFEEQFYNAKGLKNAEEGKTAPMPKFETSVELLDPMAEVQKESEVEKEKPAENSTDENAALLTKLLSNPETAALLKALAKTI